MPVKTKAELLIQNDALITTNGNEEITGSVLNIHLKDLIESVSYTTIVPVSGSYFQVIQKITSPTISGSSTSLTLSYKPLNDISIFINGVHFKTGTTNMSSFYIVNSSNTSQVRLLVDIQIGDLLYYNSTILGYTLDSSDTIEILYLAK